MSAFPPAYHAFREGKTTQPARTTRGGTDYLYLGGCVARIAYDFSTHTGQAFLLAGHCADGPSVLRYFRQTFPDVKQIETFTGPKLDMVYLVSGESADVLDCRI